VLYKILKAASSDQSEQGSTQEKQNEGNKVIKRQAKRTLACSLGQKRSDIFFAFGEIEISSGRKIL
jgi:hypothetical protein